MGREHVERTVRKYRKLNFTAIVFCLGLISLCGGYTLLRRDGNPGSAVWWLYAGGMTLVLIIWRIIVAFMREPQNLPDTFFPGLANRLTVFRGLILCGLTGFLFLEWSEGIYAWIPGVLFCIFLLLDCLDGTIARFRDEISAFGEFLDRDFDGLGTLVGILLIIRCNRVPYWYILPGLAYYVFIFARWLRQKLGYPLYPLPPSSFRRYASALQSIFIAAIMLPLPSFPESAFLAAGFAIPVVAGFLRDWRLVAGYDRR